MEKLLKQFNTKDTYLVISDYPERVVGGEKNYGIAWYTKETLEPIAKRYGQKFVVLAEKGKDKKVRVYANGKILVLRVFDPTHHTLYPVILRYLAAFSKIKRVFVHSEFGTNGGLKNFALLLPFLFLIKLFRKNVTYFAHNVVTDLSSIGPHLNLSKSFLVFPFLNAGVKFYYKILGRLCDKVVVMDVEMKRRLSSLVREEKIIFMPFWVKENAIKVSQTLARRKLGIKKDDLVILFFGFVTWYKGADWLIKQMQKKNIKLVIAGGQAYSLKDKDYYKGYYAKQIESVSKAKNIQITGFVAERDIPLYFGASDLVVFPYRGLIGSSASLLHAIENKKPFLLSDKMKAVLNNGDFAEVMESTNLKTSDILFSHKNDFYKVLTKLLSNKEKMNALRLMSRELFIRRGMNKILPEHFQSIYKSDNASTLGIKRSLNFVKGILRPVYEYIF